MGPSSISKQRSPINADISAPGPLVRLSSCTTRALPVFLIDLFMVEKSSGFKVRKSIISTTPSSREKEFTASMDF